MATTSGSSEAITATVDGLATGGELIVLGVIPEPMAISPLQLIPQAKVVYGRGSGTAKGIEDTLAFAALTGVRAIVEEAPIEDANAAYQRMLANQARFRMVLTTGK
jgi:alcohol dehydrogenase